MYNNNIYGNINIYKAEWSGHSLTYLLTYSLTDTNSNPLPDVVETCGLKIWMPDYSETYHKNFQKFTFQIRGGSKRVVKLPKFPIRITLGKVFASGLCTSRYCIKLKFAMNVGHLRHKHNQS